MLSYKDELEANDLELIFWFMSNLVLESTLFRSLILLDKFIKFFIYLLGADHLPLINFPGWSLFTFSRYIETFAYFAT